MNLGLFIGRFNPPHNGHLKTIQIALEENDSLLLLLGTPLMQDEKNPLTFSERKELIQIMFPEKNITIKELFDTQTDEEWMLSIVGIVQELVPKQTHITFYGGDFANDSAYQSFKEYEYLFPHFSLDYVELSREGSFVVTDFENFDLSATNFRNMLDAHNLDIAKKFTSEKIFSKIEEWYHKK